VNRRLVVIIGAFAVCCAREQPAEPQPPPAPAPVVQQQQTTPPPRPSTPVTETEAAPPAAVKTADDASDAVAVVQRYYEAIDAHDLDRAYACWGSSGPAGQTREQFAAGFADTATVKVETGKPSRIGAAAGSRYVDVPVTIIATTKSGRQQRFAGTYTLRRTVVDGAPASDQAWHIYRGALRRM
jgi:hypothetical protein